MKKDEFLDELVTILLHPQTEIHELRAEQVSADGMNVIIHFTAPYTLNYASDDYDDSNALSSEDLRLLGACSHNDARLIATDDICRDDTHFSAKVTVMALTKPQWMRPEWMGRSCDKGAVT